jgi:hypothetical protein
MPDLLTMNDDELEKSSVDDLASVSLGRAPECAALLAQLRQAKVMAESTRGIATAT